ncbi:vegetative cell wall protein gp1-like [Portunus trituberculatus]|uniref:vegetative cell wall protein gp1-like n=1 Tax=Portunus trituberculatus TaxID=210409 RepID=UPI001E1CC499|nr:vegetative cell wall protein gp1-like [Portunus trituberculatus]
MWAEGGLRGVDWGEEGGRGMGGCGWAWMCWYGSSVTPHPNLWNIKSIPHPIIPSPQSPPVNPNHPQSLPVTPNHPTPQSLEYKKTPSNHSVLLSPCVCVPYPPRAPQSHPSSSPSPNITPPTALPAPPRPPPPICAAGPM